MKEEGDIESLFSMLQKGSKTMDGPDISLLRCGLQGCKRRKGKGGRERPSASHLMCRIHETAAFMKTSEPNLLPDSPLNETLKSTLGSLFYRYTKVLEKEEETESCS